MLCDDRPVAGPDRDGRGGDGEGRRGRPGEAERRPRAVLRAAGPALPLGNFTLFKAFFLKIQLKFM